MHVNKMCVNYPLVYLKRNIFNIKHLNKSLHKTFILAYIRITEQLIKKNYFEKFIEELDFVEFTIQAKHLRLWILQDDWLNGSPRY